VGREVPDIFVLSDHYIVDSAALDAIGSSYGDGLT
jgi:hypothetical protein